MNEPKIPFVEKYRPKNLKDVCGNKVLFEQVSNDFSQHLLLFGAPGTGKSTAIRAFLKHVPNDSILNLSAKLRSNSSNLIKKMNLFSSKKITFHKKFIIVDEVDTIPIHEQKIFVRPLEYDIMDNNKTQNDLVFIFICNRISYVSGFILKNCVVIKYKKLLFCECKEYLLNICDTENIDISDDTLEYIYNEVNCDLRKTVSTIEFLFRMNITKNQITKNHFNEFHQNIDTRYLESIERKLVNDSLKNVVDFLHDDINSVNYFCVELLKFHKKRNHLSTRYTKLLAEMCVDSTKSTNTWFILYRLIQESPYFNKNF